jgi:hypothetical protein
MTKNGYPGGYPSPTCWQVLLGLTLFALSSVLEKQDAKPCSWQADEKAYEGEQ